MFFGVPKILYGSRSDSGTRSHANMYVVDWFSALELQGYAFLIPVFVRKLTPVFVSQVYNVAI